MFKKFSKVASLAMSAVLVTAIAGAALTGCSSGSSASSASNQSSASSSSAAKSTDKIVFVWEPNESTTAYEGMREAVAQCIEKATGLECEMMTTTDYNVTIESLVSGKAQMASLGASEYVEAHAKNPAVEIAFVLSDEEGKLNPVSYTSEISVKTDNAQNYADGAGYKLDPLKDKTFSFVNLNSTSGFVMPATTFKKEFNLDSTDDVSTGGPFFEEVLFPGSHPGSLFNLLSGESDASVFADYLVAPFVELVSGEPAKPGAVYKVKSGVDAPLDAVEGESFTIIEALPVPAVPICINVDALSPEVVEQIISYMTSDEVANNPKIFPSPDDKETVSNWTKKTDKVRFVRATDDYYDEFRELIDFQE